MSKDNTRTIQARQASAGRRVDDRAQAAQARLADKSFSEFMRAHNARRGTN